jgi:hypothetical protein
MRSSGRLFGAILLVSGLVVGVGVAAWLVQSNREGSMSGSTAIFGAVLLLGVIALPLIAGGVVLLRKGGQEAIDIANVERQRKLLGLIGARGQIAIADAVLELKTTREIVDADILELVSRGLFTGYIDPAKGILYSVEASKLRSGQTCPNCGGALELGGKGLVKCPFCGAQVFL